MIMNVYEIGLALARTRRAAGLTQAALAARIGSTQSAVSRAEAGGASPSIEFIQRFAEATGRPILLEFGRPAARARRARVRRVLGDYRFDPWERNPSPAEARTMSAPTGTRER